jgi:hypothetical protein
MYVIFPAGLFAAHPTIQKNGTIIINDQNIKGGQSAGLNLAPSSVKLPVKNRIYQNAAIPIIYLVYALIVIKLRIRIKNIPSQHMADVGDITKRELRIIWLNTYYPVLFSILSNP